MSINITVHGNALDKIAGKNVLCDPQRERKEKIVELRKQRLEQVRQQSKDLAQSVRQNVGAELKRQQRRIEEQKRKELLEWREKALSEAEEQRKKSLNAFGEAHRAALDERDEEKKREKAKRRNDIIAQQRGQAALRKEKQVKEKVPVATKPAAKAPAGVQSKKCDQDASKRPNVAVDPILNDSSSSADSSILSISEDESKSSSSSSSSLQRNKTVIMNIGTDSETSISMQDSHDASNRHFYRTKSKADETVIQKPSYNAHDYRQPDTSSEASTSLEAPPRPKQFTQISELVQKRQSKLSSLNTLDLPATTEPSASVTPKSCLKSKTQPTTVTVDPPTRISRPPPPTEATRTSRLPPPTEATKTSIISSQSKPETTNSVQFYDYNNKYFRQYEPRQDAVKPIDKSSGAAMPSAMENARLEVELQEEQRQAAEELRKKSEERGQNAIERERVRRECDLLTEKLNSINRDQPLIREIDGRGATNVFTQTKMAKDAAVRQKKMTTDFEEILKRPVVITCPEVTRKPSTAGGAKQSNSAPTTINVGNLGAMKDVPRNFDNISTSDSGASILLDYINRQSEQVSQDIKDCDNSRTMDDLSGLLRKINGLREHIVDEIGKCKARKEQSNIEELKTLMGVVNGLREERATILQEEMKNIEEMRVHLDKRAKFINEKEKRMERKLRKIADKISVRSKDIGKETTDHIINIVANDKAQCIEETKVEATISKPIEILIRLSNELSQKSGKSPFKSPRKRSSLISDQMHPRRKKSSVTKHRPAECRQQTPRKQIAENSPSRTSTSYRSIPEVINTNLGEYLASPPKPKPKLDKPEPVADKEHEKPQGVRLKTVPEKSRGTESQIVRDDQKKDLDPVLLHYIQRLLVMSRSSIDMLAVSSSNVATPSSSIIDRSSNMSDGDSILCDSERMQKLSEHVADYYNFINSMQDSIRSINSSKSSEKSSASQPKEDIWRKTLKDGQHDHVTKKMLRSILKKTSKGVVGKMTKSVETQVTDISKSEKSVEVQLSVEAAKSPPVRQPLSSTTSKADLSDGHSEQQYEEQSQNCVKRIAELEDMIEKIRQEKRKMLELTLTSGSDTARNSTEYLDFPEAARTATTNDVSAKSADNQRPVQGIQIESERGQLERNKLTGVSRDSGISLSRPVTALDSHHDSQDGRVSYDKVSPEPSQACAPKETHKLFVHEPKAVLNQSKPAKHSKPPLTIARYTPELVEELPRELSTIVEVETPATSRLNASLPDKPVPNMSIQLSESLKTIKTFPTYEEYIASRNLEATRHIDVDSDSVLHVDLSSKGLPNISAKGDLQYKDFASFKTYLREHGHDTSDTQYQNITSTQPSPDESENTNTSFKQFPSHKSYAKMLGASDLLDSQSIAAVSLTDGSTASNKLNDSESTETLPDVVAELKKRNLLRHSFRNEMKASGSDTPASSTQLKKNDMDPATVAASSGSKKAPTNKKEPTDLTGIEPLAPTSLSHTSTSDLSEPLEKELESMGLKWASRMLKKSHQSMDLGSTSSSFTYERQPRHKSPKKTPGKSKKASSVHVETVLRAAEKSLLQHDSDQSSDISGGHAFDLKAFFTKELEKRATTSLSSTSSIDDSLTSQFLKSILGSANSTPIVSLSKRAASAQEQRHHTSTPVQPKKSSPSSKSSPDSSRLFSMESAISSVRLNSMSGNEKESYSLADRDALSASHFKLNVDSKRSKSSKHDNNVKNLS